MVCAIPRKVRRKPRRSRQGTGNLLSFHLEVPRLDLCPNGEFLHPRVVVRHVVDHVVPKLPKGLPIGHRCVICLPPLGLKPFLVLPVLLAPRCVAEKGGFDAQKCKEEQASTGRVDTSVLIRGSAQFGQVGHKVRYLIKLAGEHKHLNNTFTALAYALLTALPTL